MGSVLSIRKAKSSGNYATTHLLENRSFLEEEIIKLRCKREQESRAYKRKERIFEAKQGEWRRERKMWKKEVRQLRKRLKEKDEIISQLEDDGMAAGKGDKDWQVERMNYLVEHLREEQARREEAVEKWKRLYLAIKTELDNLILRTCQGERLWWGAEEDVMEGLQRELSTKEEIIQELRAQIKAMEAAGANREKEVDMLRQSLRIVSNPKSSHAEKNFSKAALMKKTKEREINSRKFVTQ
ncbi:hypothetical protein AAC387_Pa12g2401 [Persea americana]